MRSTFKVLFYLKKDKHKVQPLVPVMGRITVNGTIAQFSAKLSVPPHLWEKGALSDRYPSFGAGGLLPETDTPDRRLQTGARHWMRKYPNLIRGFDLERPHCLWVGDITYISLKEGFAYLALLTDAYSKRIVDHDLNTTLERDGALRALRMGIDQTPKQKRQGSIHHSGRGCQYCPKEYVKLLTDNGIRISMAEKGDPYEKTVAERVNGILKSEWIDEECFESFQAAKERIDEIVILYNSLRPSASCDWLTPLEAEHRTGKLKHHWSRKAVVRKAYVNSYQDNIF